MSLPSAPLAVAVPLLVLLGLTGCTAADPAETYVSGSEAPIDTPEVTPSPVEPDTMLRVLATATADNGAQLSLELQVHQSTTWDYAGTQTLPAALIEDCGGTLTDELIASQQWSFTRVNVTAIPTAASTADWPADVPITLEPSAAYAMTAGRGMLAGDPANAPLCLAEKTFAGEGKGGLAVGIAGDAGSLTGWARHSFGFTVSGATLSDCSIVGTDLGAQSGGAGLIQTADATSCVAGPATQTREY